MRKNRFYTALLLTSALTASLFSGCSKSETDVEIPFTDITWGSSLDDIIELEGEDYESYDSVYDGTTYSYPKSYDGMDGDIKYMFDDKDKLVCIAWQCSAPDADALDDIYTDIHSSLEDTYGESGYNSGHSTNHGDVWYLEEGDIILSAVTTDSMNALLYSYLHPDVSNQEK